MSRAFGQPAALLRPAALLSSAALLLFAAVLGSAAPPVSAAPVSAAPVSAAPVSAAPVSAPASAELASTTLGPSSAVGPRLPTATVRSTKFTPTPVLPGHPQWTANTRVSYSLKNFSADEATIARAALRENGKAVRVTYYEVAKNPKLTLVRHKLYAKDSHGSRTALPDGVVGLGGPTWTSTGVIVSGKVEISPKADTLAATAYRSLLLHEIGHAAGLDHSTHVSSVMYPSLQPDSPYHYSAEDLTSLKPAR